MRPVPELPPPLPPEARTVGQLVAETIRFYGDRFWQVLPLGLAVAVLDQASLGQSRAVQIAVLAAGSPLLTLAYARAALLLAPAPAPRRAQAIAFAAGVIVFLPAAALFGWFALLAIAWLAAFGLVVPVALYERTGFRETFRRARELGFADYAHAAGSLATLTIVFFLTRLMLFFLLRGQGDVAGRVAAFLTDLVLSPLLFVGAALLYDDQRARVGRRNRAHDEGLSRPAALGGTRRRPRSPR
jgi:hypothetical protein